jgi:hypothetical protein
MSDNGFMDEDFEKSLKELIRRSHQLARQSEALAVQSKALIEQFRITKKREPESSRKRLGET